MESLCFLRCAGDFLIVCTKGPESSFTQNLRLPSTVAPSHCAAWTVCPLKSSPTGVGCWSRRTEAKMCWCEFTFNQPGTLINNGVNNGTSRLFTRTPTIELCRCCSSVVAGRVRADWACQDQIRVKTSWRDCRICRLQSITKMLLLTLLPDRSACDFFALCEIFVFWLMFLFRSNICYSTSSFFLCFFWKLKPSVSHAWLVTVLFWPIVAVYRRGLEFRSGLLKG